MNRARRTRPDAVVLLPPFPPDSPRAAMCGTDTPRHIASTKEADTRNGCIPGMLIQPKELCLVKVILRDFALSEFCEGGSEIITHMHFKTHSVEVCVGYMFGQGAARWRWVLENPYFTFLCQKVASNVK